MHLSQQTPGQPSTLLLLFLTVPINTTTYTLCEGKQPFASNASCNQVVSILRNMKVSFGKSTRLQVWNFTSAGCTEEGTV
jgi:hypothetical protein